MPMLKGEGGSVIWQKEGEGGYTSLWKHFGRISALKETIETSNGSIGRCQGLLKLEISQR